MKTNQRPKCAQGRSLRVIQPQDASGKATIAITQTGRNGKPATTEYTVEKVAADWGESWKFHKAGGNTYHVMIGEYGPECECADSVFQQRPCKHIGALLALRAKGKLS